MRPREFCSEGAFYPLKPSPSQNIAISTQTHKSHQHDISLTYNLLQVIGDYRLSPLAIGGIGVSQ